jgi:hypothetical protein
MKRPFLCGIAAILIIDGIAMLSVGHVALTKAISNSVGVVSLLAAGLLVWIATRMPRSKSWLTAILLWIARCAVGSLVLIPVFYFFGEMPSLH